MYPCPCCHRRISDQENLQVGRNFQNKHLLFQKNRKYKGISRADWWEVSGGECLVGSVGWDVSGGKCLLGCDWWEVTCRTDCESRERISFCYLL